MIEFLLIIIIIQLKKVKTRAGQGTTQTTNSMSMVPLTRQTRCEI